MKQLVCESLKIHSGRSRLFFLNVLIVCFLAGFYVLIVDGIKYQLILISSALWKSVDKILTLL
jgi:hypothetical protein